MAKSIMIQGTMSNAGKSLLCAGLCRIFRQDGYRTAPFKSQNMALNSFVTQDGLEMGRAQAVQAEAAGLAPDVRMNPILLKPTSDVGSQVIVGGKPIGTMPAREYFQYKKRLIPAVLEAYGSLAAENDIIVLEGAGSPAEINLKAEDIVNMGMAQMARAPVLLAGDIDRGGVFASLYGTVALLEPAERRRIQGLIINKFRGDVEILRPGLTQLKELTGKPVVGVVPYLQVDIDDEDSLSDRLERQREALIDIAVIRLPRISNFTDFNALEQIPDRLGRPDLILLPGTKNTMGDLQWLRESGMETAILKEVSRDTPLLGICGGYQMMGESLEDPEGVEQGGAMRGMGLLPLRTRFARQKTRTQVRGQMLEQDGFFSALAGAAFEGYEIHMGQTDAGSAPPLICVDGSEGSKPAGAGGGNAAGCYIHGLFDSGSVREQLAQALYRRKGLDPATVQTRQQDYGAYKEEQYDILAQALRHSLDMETIYRMMDQWQEED